MDIAKAFAILMEFEGGLSNLTNDKGGLTKYGISHNSYPDIDIASLTQDQAKAIYERDYWTKAHCSDVPLTLQYILFDTAVNMGTITAIKLLQQVSGVTADGIFGPETQTKCSCVIPSEYLLYRLMSYNLIVGNDPTQLVFLKGWTNRVMKVMQMSKTGALS